MRTELCIPHKGIAPVLISAALAVFLLLTSAGTIRLIGTADQDVIADTAAWAQRGDACADIGDDDAC